MAMLPGGSGSPYESEDQMTSGSDKYDYKTTNKVPKEVTRFVQELVTNAEAVEKKNKLLKKKISILQKKCDRMRQHEQKFKKQKVEMLQLFRKYLEKRSVKKKSGCKSCPLVQSDLEKAKHLVATLLHKQKDKDTLLMDRKKDLEKEKMKVEEKELEVQKFQQKCSERKLEEKKHFRRAQWEAQFIRHRIELARDKIEKHFGEEGVVLAKEAATKAVVYEASIEAPAKFEEFEREVAEEAKAEILYAIADKDHVEPNEMPPDPPQDYFWPGLVKDRRERSMREIERGASDPWFIFN